MDIDFPIPFAKMSGTGNDFIIIDHRTPLLRGIDLADFARAVCRRRFSVGADGLILIETTPTAGVDFQWLFFNGDGSRAEMCGNGARCAARFAFSRGIAPANMRFQTDAGVIEARINPASPEKVRVRLTVPTDIQLHRSLVVDDSGHEEAIHSINTGVPHTMVLVDDARTTPVVDRGRRIRHHAMFQPAGANVNFTQILGPNALLVRTYERGVEDETMACGTGAVAAAVLASLLGRVAPPVQVTTSGGELLTIYFTAPKSGGMTIDEVFLEGPANFIYQGRLEREALRAMP